MGLGNVGKYNRSEKRRLIENKETNTFIRRKSKPVNHN